MDRELDKLVTGMQRRYGEDKISYANKPDPVDVIPTGILALDYRLGVGGWPRKHVIGVFGPPDIGKSSTIALTAIAQAQKAGIRCGLIKIEPHFDPEWAKKLGVDVDNGLILTRPEDGKEAFDHLYEMVTSGILGLVVLDSIGAMLSPTEAELEGKPKAGGQAGLITWGVKRILTPAWRNNVAVILLNQVREDMNAYHAGVMKQPGGKAIEHGETIIIQLRRASGAAATYKAKDETGEDVIIGNQLIAEIKKNQAAEGTGQRAIFDFYQKEMEGCPFGIDTFSDIINTGMMLGIVQRGGAFYTLPDGTKHQGMDKVKAHLIENPHVIDQIRTGVMEIMASKAVKPRVKE